MNYGSIFRPLSEIAFYHFPSLPLPLSEIVLQNYWRDTLGLVSLYSLSSALVRDLTSYDQSLPLGPVRNFSSYH